MCAFTFIDHSCTTNIDTHTHPRRKRAPEKEMLYLGYQFFLFVDITSSSCLFGLVCYCIFKHISNPAEITNMWT
jgi:hypothetical protein